MGAPHGGTQKAGHSAPVLSWPCGGPNLRARPGGGSGVPSGRSKVRHPRRYCEPCAKRLPDPTSSVARRLIPGCVRGGGGVEWRRRRLLWPRRCRTGRAGERVKRLRERRQTPPRGSVRSPMQQGLRASAETPKELQM